MDTSEFGMSVAPVMYPIYSMGLILSTTLIVLLTTSVVSYWPARRIAKMNPTEALRGKIQ
jgi:ABC-type antimicrobial peptide transport system permease subunit